MDRGAFNRFDDCFVGSYSATPDHESDISQFYEVNSATLGMRILFAQSGFAHTVYRRWNLARTEQLHQLGYLFPPNQEHNRFRHMITAYAFATMISEKLGLSDVASNTLRFAALTHDAAMAAGGDMTKFLSPTELDEDANYEAWLLTPGYEKTHECLEYLGVDYNLLLQTIANQGVLGTLLDWVDKNSYVAIDLDFLHEYELALGTTLRPSLEPEVITSAMFLWDTIMIHDGIVCTTNSETLKTFLLIRAHLFTQVYLSPAVRLNYVVHCQLLFAMLYKTGELTTAELLTMSDADARALINKCYGFDHGNHTIPQSAYLKIHLDLSKNTARRKVREHLADPDTLGFFMESLRGQAQTITKPMRTMPYLHNGVVTLLSSHDFEFFSLLATMASSIAHYSCVLISDLHVYEPDMLSVMRDFCREHYQ